jgi:hypothetical protein
MSPFGEVVEEVTANSRAGETPSICVSPMVSGALGGISC